MSVNPGSSVATLSQHLKDREIVFGKISFGLNDLDTNVLSVSGVAKRHKLSVPLMWPKGCDGFPVVLVERPQPKPAKVDKV